MKVVYLTRTYRFNAGHRLFDPGRDEAWNREVFGKCSLPGGHGHNYTLEVTVRGSPDPETGQILKLEALDAAVAAVVHDRIDHRNLNEVLSKTHGPAPTTEVLILELWPLLDRLIPAPVSLHRLIVAETTKNTFEYHGPAPCQETPGFVSMPPGTRAQ